MQFVPVQGNDDDAWTNHVLRRLLSRAHKLMAEMHGQLHLSGLKHTHDTKLIKQLCDELDECERQLERGSARLHEEKRLRQEAEAKLRREKRARQEAEDKLQQEKRARQEAEAQAHMQAPQPPQAPQPKQPQQPRHRQLIS